MPIESPVQVTGHPRIKWWAFVPFAFLTFVHLYALAVGISKLADNTQSFLMVVLLFGFLLAIPPRVRGSLEYLAP
ncbi:hypothetical protein CQ018_07945 [Arthrobacter sp. MYb227]|uniref:hypothetical protein n=1 Tax=Arthrobacter sp. MYb227 TaxID=1848601 RepID=UPI000CFCBE7A|nr:hypothetical protein [Arthrobacter sp. MYb227]PQZ93592.1 hypothetical protein CQ018_07945 [Arthrobacter sp. MYb227]